MTEENYDSEMPLGFGNEMDNVVGRISSCGSRKRPIPQSFYPAHVQQQPSSHKHRSTGEQSPLDHSWTSRSFYQYY